MAETVVSCILRFISDKLESKALSAFALQIGIDKEFRNLRQTLLNVYCWVEDAEATQVKVNALRKWLSWLKELAYEVDDLVDELAFQATKLMKASTQEKVCNLIYFPKKIIWKREIAQRLKEINERLDMIVGFYCNQGEILNVEVNSRIVRKETSSFLDGQEVYGMNEDKEKIIEFLMNDSNRGGVDVVAIVGLGGVGKTTLAKFVYNDERVCKHFEKRMWIFVPEECEIIELARLIINLGTGETISPGTVVGLERALQNKLKDKRFLLILDDVWAEGPIKEDWKTLHKFISIGAKGSKVIVTTRNERIASIMGTIPPYRLSGLSVEDCWLLFESIAFGNEVERHPYLTEIGKEIVRKCAGVPFTAKALGMLLRCQRKEVHQWKIIRDSELWKLFDKDAKYIFHTLKLSYDYLTSDLKQCFSYSAIFPRDYEIDTKMLVKLWGAEGFLKSPIILMDWEYIGLKHVDQLLTMSLFQKSGCTGKIKMHDLVHDLAQYVAGDECSVVDISAGRLLSHNSRYASFICMEKPLSVVLESQCNARKLRTFYLDLTQGKREETELGVQKVLDDIPSKFNLLRALHLSGYPLKALPDSFKKLKHLRYLNLSDNAYLETFPPCITTMHNLQTLNLRHSKIESIPDSIENLHNLCALDMSYCFHLSSLPTSIGRLKCLSELDLSYSGITSLPESICSLPKLHTLNLEYCSSIHELPQNLSNMKSLHLCVGGCTNLNLHA